MPAHSPEPGATVGGKYRLVRRIGFGGMGEVWVAENRTTGAEVAVKMARGAALHEDALVRFRHEARLGAMLAHRSVVRIFDLVEESDGTLVLVMELLRGESLDRYMSRRAPLATREAIAIAVPLLAALAHAHETGIVHRDVTPANVFLAVDPDGYVTPKLLDFGVAKLPSSAVKHTVDGRVLGTPRYMAPERIREQSEIDGRSDLFSVGVLLYEMLTGVCPFAASSPAASLAAVLEAVVDPDPRLEPRIWLEVQRALSKQPYERQPNALAMANALLAACGETEASSIEVLRRAPISRLFPGAEAIAGALAGGTPTGGGHSLGGARTPSSARRGRTVAWIAGVFLLAVALATIGASFRARPSGADRPPRPAEDVSTGAAPSMPPVDGPSASAASEVSAVLPASTASSGSPVPSPVRGPVRPRAVATTPGF